MCMWIADLYNSRRDIDDSSSNWCPKADHSSSQDLQSVRMMILIPIPKKILVKVLKVFGEHMK